MSYYYDNETEAVERRIDYDLSAAMEYAITDTQGFRLEDVAYVLAYLQGEHDGPDYHWIVAMKDHTYAYVQGGCDYTGWDCQAGGTVQMFVSLREALSAAEEVSIETRKLLTKQLTGEASFGESTPSTY